LRLGQIGQPLLEGPRELSQQNTGIDIVACLIISLADARNGNNLVATPQEPDALAAGRGDDPPRQRSRLSDALKMLEQGEANDLYDVIGIAVLEPIAARYGADNRHGLLDQYPPGTIVTLARE
jgi:hypothetical protein